MEVLYQLSYSPDLGRLRLPTTRFGSQRVRVRPGSVVVRGYVGRVLPTLDGAAGCGNSSVRFVLPVDLRHVAVEAFDLVVGADLVAEDVDHGVAIVDQHPLLLGHPLDA